MVITRLMSKAPWLALAPLTFCLAGAVLNACGSGDGRPDSFVNAGGATGRGGAANAGRGGSSAGDAGQANHDAGSDGGDDAAAGAAGDASGTAAPIAIFPQQLQVDVGCGGSTEPAQLLIQNGGVLPLTISSAMATGGYEVKTELPLQIEARASAYLQIAPPPPKAKTTFGQMSTGSLSFVTNEADTPTHEVLLNTTLFGGQIEFTDHQGTALSAALPLTYLSSAACPDDVTYRVHNTGNLAFTLFGPTFPSHLGGTSTGASGQNVPPDQYVEFKVSGNSSTDGACSGNGSLTFSVQGAFCGSVPQLDVRWPANIKTTDCSCTAATD